MSRFNHASQEHQTFTARATRVAIGIKIQRPGLLQPIFQKVRILPGREVGRCSYHPSRRRSRAGGSQ